MDTWVADRPTGLLPLGGGERRSAKGGSAMDEQQGGSRGTGMGRQWRRRGLMAGAGALVAAVLARASERGAQATDGTALFVAGNNTATGATSLTRSNASSATAFHVDNDHGDAIYATALGGRGVYANTTNGTSAAVQADSSNVGSTASAGSHEVSAQTSATTAS